MTQTSTRFQTKATEPQMGLVRTVLVIWWLQSRRNLTRPA